MKSKGQPHGGRTSDLTFGWLTQCHGKQWDAWRRLAEEWIRGQDKGLSTRQRAVAWFLESYLVAEKLPSDPVDLFALDLSLPDLGERLGKSIKSQSNVAQRNNYLVEFIDWVIGTAFSTTNEHGVSIPRVNNPFERLKKERNAIETVWSPLPYVYIQELRSILCPDTQGHFGDWTWAQRPSGTDGQRGWFKVAPSLINRNDPDCVWRERTVSRNDEQCTITELWSPVSAVAMLIKLHLPLRTYQVRMLDSGEADTWRYKGGQWVLNGKHEFAVGSEKAPWQPGVFRRIRVPDVDELMTGFYINTNKTADQNKEAVDRGYVIPWQHEQLLYWIEKLRNWQERYNPITAPTPWKNLKYKHIGELKSPQTLALMGEACFLFRDPAATQAEDRDKPISMGKINRLWYLLLKELEDRTASRGQALADGSRLRFVKQYREDVPEAARTATEFPPHSLRVSLITSYAMDGHVPLPVLSKLLAGHSRIFMTIYYNKISPTVMREKMAKAEASLLETGENSLQSFLEDASLSQIQNQAAFLDGGSIAAALVNRNPVSWEQRHIGLCLAGGNNSESTGTASVAGCWNGGEVAVSLGSKDPLHGPVPHGPENCVRCRWFLTDARYLDALRAHFNNLSYQATLAANLAVDLEQARDALEDERFEADQESRPFTRLAELQQAQRRYEKQLVEADEYAKDLRACFTLIHRLVAIESERAPDDDQQKFIAVGALDDIRQPIGLLETDSELWQLAEICEDAELYPDLADSLRKTPAIEKRSRALNMILMREGYTPLFMHMDDQMQLILGNALIRAMAKQACSEDWRIEGFRRVSGIIEAEHSLQELGILKSALAAVEEQWGDQVATLGELTEVSKSVPREVGYDKY